jgi:hypothetical protein
MGTKLQGSKQTAGKVESPPVLAPLGLDVVVVELILEAVSVLFGPLLISTILMLSVSIVTARNLAKVL